METNTKPNPNFIYKSGERIKVWDDVLEEWQDEVFFYRGFIEDEGEIVYIVQEQFCNEYRGYLTIGKIEEPEELIEYGEQVEVRNPGSDWTNLFNHKYLGSVIDLDGNKIHVTQQGSNPNLWKYVRKVRNTED